MDLAFAQKLLAAQSVGLVLSENERASAEQTVLLHTTKQMREMYTERGKGLAGQVTEACVRRDPGYIRDLVVHLRHFADAVEDFERRADAALDGTKYEPPTVAYVSTVAQA